MNAEQFRVICAWCGGVQRVGEPGEPTSHTICQPCAYQARTYQDEGKGRLQTVLPPAIVASQFTLSGLTSIDSSL